MVLGLGKWDMTVDVVAVAIVGKQLLVGAILLGQCRELRRRLSACKSTAAHYGRGAAIIAMGPAVAMGVVG